MQRRDPGPRARNTDYELLVKECTQAVQEGRVPSAVKRLKELNLARVPREWRLPLANLCRRSRLLDHGMRLLAPVIRERREKTGPPASLEERCEYATLLERIGATQEALKLARSLDFTKVPEALFCQVACHFSKWDFESAIPLLRQYIELIHDPYRKLIGKVNLVSALIGSSQTASGLELLNLCLDEVQAGSHLRLYANCLELRAQSNIELGNTAAAKSDLEVASRLLGDGKTIDSLFVGKWRALIASKESGNGLALREFKKKCQELKQWENAREAQFQILKIEFDPDEFESLYFGTPYPAYRKRIIREFDRSPRRGEYRLGPDEGIFKVDGPTLNIMTGEFQRLSVDLKTGSQTHKLIEVLFRDFFRAIPISEIFADLFPEEYFDVFSSPLRVRQSVCRARAWLRKHGVPIAILENGGQYSARVQGRLSIIIPREHGAPQIEALRITKLWQHFAQQPFTAREARKILKMSMTSFNRLVTSALESGTLVKAGSGPSTRYRIGSFEPASSAA